ncbi:MAG: hypothetical protein IT389_04650 [Nitrospira sp.]|nr:hypothetical protein [Nitrospira sp.]
MRIEVEVYKGPLSLEPEIQLSELYGYLVEAQNGMLGIWKFAKDGPEDSWWRRTSLGDSLRSEVIHDSFGLANNLERSICLFDKAFSKASGDCENLPLLQRAVDAVKALLLDQSGVPNSAEGTKKAVSVLMNQIREEYEEANAKRSSVPLSPGAFSKVSADVLADISRTAAAMQVAAFRYATMSAVGVPWNTKARIAATLFMAAASEYGNQIEARADALRKQLPPYGRDRRELPLSTHLREAEPTDFVHLFDWADGHLPRPLDYLTFNISPNMDERIKIIDRLYGDHFWSKINTAYASGRGQMQMAFIKDETGNWSLKSFASDPTELLDAYTKAAKTALEGVMEVTKKLASGDKGASIILADQLLALADQSADPQRGTAPSTPGTLSLTHLQTRLANQLTAVDVEKELDEEGKLVQAVKDAKTANDQIDQTDQDALKKSTAKLNEAAVNLAKHRTQVIKRWEKLLRDHSDLVDTLSATVKRK